MSTVMPPESPKEKDEKPKEGLNSEGLNVTTPLPTNTKPDDPEPLHQ